MAGAGKKTFTAGEILTASDTNTYLMEQTVMNFAGTAARASAIPTPSTGMTTYNQETKQLESYNGSAYVGMSGLQLIKKQTIGSAVTSVTVTGAFSATYDAYKVIVSGGSATNQQILALSFPSNTTGYYWSAKNLSWTGTTQDYLGSNTSNFNRVGYHTTDHIYANFELVNPFATKNTLYTATYIAALVGGDGAYATGALLNTNSITSFTLTAGGGTLTGGTISVYGYGL
jgi:hypothetical protein